MPLPVVGDCGPRRVSVIEGFWTWWEREREGDGGKWLGASVSSEDVVMRICSGVLGA